MKELFLSNLTYIGLVLLLKSTKIVYIELTLKTMIITERNKRDIYRVVRKY